MKNKVNWSVVILVIFIGLILLIGSHIISDASQYIQDDMLSAEWISWRIRPVGETHIQYQNRMMSTKGIAEIVHTQCGVCHLSGVYHAPRLDHPEDWYHRQATGFSAFVRNTIHGKGKMPPRGGFDLTDAQIHQSVLWMIQELGIELSSSAAKQQK